MQIKFNWEPKPELTPSNRDIRMDPGLRQGDNKRLGVHLYPESGKLVYKDMGLRQGDEITRIMLY